MPAIGELELDNPLVIAPLAGVSDPIFRDICREHGCALAFTEMISAKGLIYGSRETRLLLPRAREPRPIGVQLFGAEPQTLARAAARVQEVGPVDLVDLNMGCPVKKVVKNGEGAALMRQPQLAARVVRAVARAVTVPVTVKLRAGWEAGGPRAPDLAPRLVEAGARALAVHGRTVEQQYSGEADWEVIRRVREAVPVTVVGNGDVFSPRDASSLLESTGAGGVMLARGLLGNPWLISRTRAWLTRGELPPEPTGEERLNMALDHLERRVEYYGERQAVLEMRKFAAWYVKGLPGAARMRAELTTSPSSQHMRQVLSRTLLECESWKE